MIFQRKKFVRIIKKVAWHALSQPDAKYNPDKVVDLGSEKAI